ncbi:MAG: tetratricopeptide repeat protein [Proteobacteria bacterium]|jgi:tetratricopeptide (TPR) repeat protein|nr:tetratricopeptide repeat protein [Pseudomonadota bacterium]MDA1302504.1 tetratricopeptide repeat protein [Pseudomonadota bacterium]
MRSHSVKRESMLAALGFGVLLSINLSISAGAEQAVTLAGCRDLQHTSSGASECYRKLLAQTTDSLTSAEALWGLGDLQRANQAFQIAARARPDDAAVRSRWGWLYLETGQTADAEALFTEAHAIKADDIDALVGLAEIATNGFMRGAEQAILRALAVDPRHPRANMLLARLHLEADDTASAQALLQEVLATEGDLESRLQALALLAAVAGIDGLSPDEWTSRALAMAPAFGDIYAVPAYFYIITRRYSEAVALLEQAVAIDPDNYAAHATLGVNLLRVNRLDEARNHLEIAYAGHPYDARVVNTLRLLDDLDEYTVHATDDEIVRVSPDEAEVVTPYVLDLISQARREMTSRYRFELTEPMVVELYPHHSDFAVRTEGLPGIGILGAAFGNVVVMNGPTAQDPDQFDWSNALWHELAHIYTLTMTGNLVTRWFSEGVSVFEEWVHGPAARESVSLGFLQAYAEGLLLPIAELDNGFMRPAYENQIEVSYVQSGLVCQFIDEYFDGGLVRILHAYRDGADTSEAIETALGISPAELDRQFADYLETRFGSIVLELKAFRSELATITEAMKARQWSIAILAAGQATERYPEYVGPNSPYLALGMAAHEAGQDALAKQALLAFWRRGGRNLAGLDLLAEYAREDDDHDILLEIARVQALAEPMAQARHRQLGDLLSNQGAYQDALQEYQAVLALQPFDAAGAHFKVAQSLYRLNRRGEALHQVLLALEIAPRFRPALALLTQLLPNDRDEP